VLATFYGILCFLAIDTLPPTSLPGYQSLFFNIAETNANYLAVLFKYVTVPSHHHASSRMSLQEGWVANTSFSTLFCRQLYPDISATLPSSRIQSINRFIGRPLFLVPDSLHSMTAHLHDRLIFNHSLHLAIYHLSLFSRVFSIRADTFN
jgi:hypothetical protein